MFMVIRMVSSKGRHLLRVKSLPGFMTNPSGCCFMSEMVFISFLWMLLGVKTGEMGVMGVMCENLLKVRGSEWRLPTLRAAFFLFQN